MTRRTDRVSAALRRAVQEVIARGLSDPRVRGLITVTEVSVTPDLADARVSVSVLPASDQELTIHGLEAAAAHIRHEVSELVDLNRMPRLIFRPDARIKKEAAVLRDIHLAAESSRTPPAEKSRWAPARDKSTDQQSPLDEGRDRGEVRRRDGDQKKEPGK
ncbi:MAG: hypothetical protein AMXMBFR58_00980 [Phycisphaerae bacterium]|nr:Ribosome-binding factor A [Phycisphaerales bacterium]